MALNTNVVVDRMRLLTGDFIEDEPYLDDDIYMWFYEENGNSEVDGAVEALEAIINNISLSPARWQIGDASETGPALEALEKRLLSLKAKRSGSKVPVVIKSDRKNWCDFESAFN